MHEDKDIAIALLHIEANQRQAALAQATLSMANYDPPAGDDAIARRAEKFYDLLSVSGPAD